MSGEEKAAELSGRLILPRRRAIALRAADFDAIIAHARREAPLEACGILVGRGDEAVRVRCAVNALRSPVAFEVDPGALLDVILQAEAEGLDVVGYFHSHPASPAYPSATDVRYAAGWPGVVHLIVSLAEAAPIVRAFDIVQPPDTQDASDASTGGESHPSAPASGEALIREVEVLLR